MRLYVFAESFEMAVATAAVRYRAGLGRQRIEVIWDRTWNDGFLIGFRVGTTYAVAPLSPLNEAFRRRP